MNLRRNSSRTKIAHDHPIRTPLTVCLRGLPVPNLCVKRVTVVSSTVQIRQDTNGVVVIGGTECGREPQSLVLLISVPQKLLKESTVKRLWENESLSLNSSIPIPLRLSNVGELSISENFCSSSVQEKEKGDNEEERSDAVVLMIQKENVTSTSLEQQVLHRQHCKSLSCTHREDNPDGLDDKIESAMSDPTLALSSLGQLSIQSSSLLLFPSPPPPSLPSSQVDYPFIKPTSLPSQVREKRCGREIRKQQRKRRKQQVEEVLRSSSEEEVVMAVEKEGTCADNTWAEEDEEWSDKTELSNGVLEKEGEVLGPGGGGGGGGEGFEGGDSAVAWEEDRDRHISTDSGYPTSISGSDASRELGSNSPTIAESTSPCPSQTNPFPSVFSPHTMTDTPATMRESSLETTGGEQSLKEATAAVEKTQQNGKQPSSDTMLPELNMLLSNNMDSTTMFDPEELLLYSKAVECVEGTGQGREISKEACYDIGPLLDLDHMLEMLGSSNEVVVATEETGEFEDLNVNELCQSILNVEDSCPQSDLVENEFSVIGFQMEQSPVVNVASIVTVEQEEEEEPVAVVVHKKRGRPKGSCVGPKKKKLRVSHDLKMALKTRSGRKVVPSFKMMSKWRNDILSSEKKASFAVGISSDTSAAEEGIKEGSCGVREEEKSEIQDTSEPLSSATAKSDQGLELEALWRASLESTHMTVPWQDCATSLPVDYMDNSTEDGDDDRDITQVLDGAVDDVAHNPFQLHDTCEGFHGDLESGGGRDGGQGPIISDNGALVGAEEGVVEKERVLVVMEEGDGCVAEKGSISVVMEESEDIVMENGEDGDRGKERHVEVAGEDARNVWKMKPGVITVVEGYGGCNHLDHNDVPTNISGRRDVGVERRNTLWRNFEQRKLYLRLHRLPASDPSATPSAFTCTSLPGITSSTLLPPTSSSTLLPLTSSSTLLPSITSSTLLPSITSSALLPSITSSTLLPSITSSTLLPSITSSTLLPSITSSTLLPPITTLPPTTSSTSLPPITTLSPTTSSISLPPITTRSASLPPITSSTSPPPTTRSASLPPTTTRSASLTKSTSLTLLSPTTSSTSFLSNVAYTATGLSDILCIPYILPTSSTADTISSSTTVPGNGSHCSQNPAVPTSTVIKKPKKKLKLIVNGSDLKKIRKNKTQPFKQPKYTTEMTVICSSNTMKHSFQRSSPHEDEDYIDLHVNEEDMFSEVEEEPLKRIFPNMRTVRAGSERLCRDVKATAQTLATRKPVKTRLGRMPACPGKGKFNTGLGTRSSPGPSNLSPAVNLKQSTSLPVADMPRRLTCGSNPGLMALLEPGGKFAPVTSPGLIGGPVFLAPPVVNAPPSVVNAPPLNSTPLPIARLADESNGGGMPLGRDVIPLGRCGDPSRPRSSQSTGKLCYGFLKGTCNSVKCMFNHVQVAAAPLHLLEEFIVHTNWNLVPRSVVERYAADSHSAALLEAHFNTFHQMLCSMVISCNTADKVADWYDRLTGMVRIKFNVTFLCRLLSYFAGTRPAYHMARAQTIVFILMNPPYQLSPEACRRLCDILEGHHMLEELKQVYAAMKEKGFYLDSLTICTLLKSTRELGEWILQIVSDIKFIERQNKEEAASLVKQLLLAMDFKILAKKSSVQKFLNYLEFSPQIIGLLSPEAFGKLAQAVESCRMWTLLVILLYAGLNLVCLVHRTIICKCVESVACFGSGVTKKVVAIVARLSDEQRAMLSNEAWEKVLLFCASNNQSQMAIKFYSALTKFSRQLSFEVMVSLIELHKRQHNPVMAMSILQDGLQYNPPLIPPLPLLSAVVVSVGVVSSAQDLYLVITKLLSRRVSPSLEVLEVLLGLISKERCYSKLAELVRTAADLEVILDKTFYRKAAVELDQWGQDRGVVTILSKVLEEEEEEEGKKDEWTEGGEDEVSMDIVNDAFLEGSFENTNSSLRTPIKSVGESSSLPGNNICNCRESGHRSPALAYHLPIPCLPGNLVAQPSPTTTTPTPTIPPTTHPNAEMLAATDDMLPSNHQDIPTKELLSLILMNGKMGQFKAVASILVDMVATIDSDSLILCLWDTLTNSMIRKISSTFSSLLLNLDQCRSNLRADDRRVCGQQAGSSLLSKDCWLMSQLGIGLLCVCQQSEDWQVAFSVLQTLHSFNLHYVQLSQPPSPLPPFLPSPPSPCSVAMTAINICLHADSCTNSAMEVLRGSDWVEASSVEEEDQRMDLVTEVAQKCLSTGALKDAEKCLESVTSTSMKERFVHLVSDLYNKLLQAVLDKRDVDFSLRVFCAMKCLQLQCLPSVFSNLVQVLCDLNQSCKAEELCRQAIVDKCYAPLYNQDPYEAIFPPGLTRIETRLLLADHLTKLRKDVRVCRDLVIQLTNGSREVMEKVLTSDFGLSLPVSSETKSVTISSSSSLRTSFQPVSGTAKLTSLLLGTAKPTSLSGTAKLTSLSGTAKLTSLLGTAKPTTSVPTNSTISGKSSAVIGCCAGLSDHQELKLKKEAICREFVNSMKQFYRIKFREKADYTHLLRLLSVSFFKTSQNFLSACQEPTYLRAGKWVVPLKVKEEIEQNVCDVLLKVNVYTRDMDKELGLCSLSGRNTT